MNHPTSFISQSSGVFCLVWVWGLFRGVLTLRCVVIAVSTDEVNNYFLL